MFNTTTGTDETTGVCFFAYNNEHIDYVQLAVLAAAYVKKHMKHNTTCLITDEGTWAWAEESQGAELINELFDDVVFTNVEHKENTRVHHDSPWTKFEAKFHNSNKHLIWEYSPYDRTLLLDIDFIVQNNSLDYIFDTDNHVTMFRDALSVNRNLPHIYEQYLEPQGVDMWWSTVVYFDRSELSKMFFDTWAHVADNYEYYKFIYNWPGKMYRTDYCVSVATHILNGFQEGDAITKFNLGPMIYMDQKDDLVDCKTDTDWVYLANNRDENWKNILVRVKDTNVHAMNKRALGRQFEKLMEGLGH
jgi:hypothetical protein